MELSVLERQRALLLRICQDQFLMESDHHKLQWQPHHHSPPPHRRSPHNSTQPHSQCNTTVFPKKRKAEFDIEEERESKEMDAAAEEKSVITMKTQRETSANTSSKASMKAAEVQKPDYIHVRARRGQATDSHSIAERARREKISKKMKCLQDLVPGCNNVTGKAGMLDEIINYVQSLQKQVEFLSMKLAAANPRLDFSIDNCLSKEIPAYIDSIAAAQVDVTNPACFEYNTMQLGINVAMDQPHFHQTLTSKPEVFLDSSCICQLSGCQSDWQSLFQ